MSAASLSTSPRVAGIITTDVGADNGDDPYSNLASTLLRKNILISDSDIWACIKGPKIIRSVSVSLSNQQPLRVWNNRCHVVFRKHLYWSFVYDKVACDSILYLDDLPFSSTLRRLLHYSMRVRQYQVCTGMEHPLPNHPIAFQTLSSRTHPPSPPLIKA